jgi:DNA repair protein RAD50
MDVEIPQLLGVSKAVLENVIFCHQEDSYWPFAEPSYLKKKFDEIFEATRFVFFSTQRIFFACSPSQRRYAKALDSIKTLRKERTQGLKTDNAVLAGLKQEKDRADDVKKNLAETRSTIANKESEYEQLKRQYDAQVVSNQQFYEHATKFRETYIHIENLVKQKERLQEDFKELKLNLQELAGKSINDVRVRGSLD